MNKQIDPEKVKQTQCKLRDICTMFDAQIMVLDELIAQVEASNRDNLFYLRKKERGKQLLALQKPSQNPE